MKRRIDKIEGVLEKMMEKVLEIADAGAEREPKRSKGGKANGREASPTNPTIAHLLTTVSCIVWPC